MTKSPSQNGTTLYLTSCSPFPLTFENIKGGGASTTGQLISWAPICVPTLLSGSALLYSFLAPSSVRGPCLLVRSLGVDPVFQQVTSAGPWSRRVSLHGGSVLLYI